MNKMGRKARDTRRLLSEGRRCLYCDGEVWSRLHMNKGQARSHFRVPKGMPSSTTLLAYSYATIEHIVRRAEGGGNKDNIALACAWCNSARQESTPDVHRVDMQALVAAGLHPVNRRPGADQTKLPGIAKRAMRRIRAGKPIDDLVRELYPQPNRRTHSMEDQTTPAPAIGDNAPKKPDPAALAEWLKAEYAEIVGDITRVNAKARDLPKEITDADQIAPFRELVKDLRDLHKKLEAFRNAEKAPYLRCEQVIDGFFHAEQGRIERRKDTDNAGSVNILLGRVDAWNQKVLAEQKAAREAEERARRAEEDRLRREAEERQRAADEAAAKAARARNADNKAAAAAEAERQRQEADRLRAEEEAARMARIDAQAAAAAKPADMTRQHLDGGGVNTMKQVPYVELVDRDQLDWPKLVPHFKDDHILMAIKSWAKSTGHKVKMAGAIVEMRNKTDLR